MDFCNDKFIHTYINIIMKLAHILIKCIFKKLEHILQFEIFKKLEHIYNFFEIFNVIQKLYTIISIATF